MANTLIDFASSEYASAMSLMRSAQGTADVYIYVEGWSDVSFWSEIIRPFSRKFNFYIEPYRDPDSRYHDGKKRLFEAVPLESLGTNLVIAVDADYDFIIDHYQPWSDMDSKSAEIRKNPYILHTYLYSIENYKCWPSAVEGYITKTCGVKCGVDICKYLETYSVALSKLFLIHLVSIDKRDKIYTLSEFITDVNKVRVNLEDSELSESSKKYIEDRLRKLQNYRNLFTNEVNNFEKKLRKLGFEPKDYYLLFQGHCVADTMIKNRIPSWIMRTRNSQIKKFRNLAESNTEKDIQEAIRHCGNYCNITGIDEKNKLEDIEKRVAQLINDFTGIYLVKPWHSYIQNDVNRIFGKK